jgi:negative regulator of replication initiation
VRQSGSRSRIRSKTLSLGLSISNSLRRKLSFRDLPISRSAQRRAAAKSASAAARVSWGKEARHTQQQKEKCRDFDRETPSHVHNRCISIRTPKARLLYISAPLLSPPRTLADSILVISSLYDISNSKMQNFSERLRSPLRSGAAPSPGGRIRLPAIGLPIHGLGNRGATIDATGSLARNAERLTI